MGLGWVTGRVGLQVPPPVKKKASGVGAGRYGAGRRRRSLGAVVPVVVDADRSRDAADNEWDPSGDQIEPGEEWGLGSEMWGTKWVGNRCSEALTRGLCPILFPL